MSNNQVLKKGSDGTYHLEPLDFGVPPRLNGLPITSHFVGREREIKEIERSLLPTDPQGGRRIHILHGLGGIGKTQLAIAYLRRHQETYSTILWLRGNSRDTLLQSLAAFATYARINVAQTSTVKITEHGEDIAEKANTVLRWLAIRENCRWLVVFDNVDQDYHAGSEDSQAYDIESFLPDADYGSILITTRLPHLGDLGVVTKISEVNSEHAIRILTNNSRLPQDTPGIPTFQQQSPGQSSWLTDGQIWAAL
jgi:AAA ATPase domain